MKITLSILFILLFNFGFSQTQIKKSSISTGGGTATSGNTQVLFTLGETAIQEQTQGNLHLSEGFISVDILSSIGYTDYALLAGVNIYPNPVVDRAVIQLPVVSAYDLFIYDLKGNEIMKLQINNVDFYRIDLPTLQAGFYLVHIVDQEHRKHSIIKIEKL